MGKLKEYYDTKSNDNESDTVGEGGRRKIFLLPVVSIDKNDALYSFLSERTIVGRKRVALERDIDANLEPDSYYIATDFYIDKGVLTLVTDIYGGLGPTNGMFLFSYSTTIPNDSQELVKCYG